MWWWIAYFAAFIVGTLIAAALYLHTPREWWCIYCARRNGWRCGSGEHSLLPRKLKNWWGRRNGFGCCGRCGDSWWWKPKHVTMYQDDAPSRENAGTITGAGCFPLCEQCWVWLGTPKDRMPYYVAMIAWWAEDSPVPLPQQLLIFNAVAEGK